MGAQAGKTCGIYNEDEDDSSLMPAPGSCGPVVSTRTETHTRIDANGKKSVVTTITKFDAERRVVSKTTTDADGNESDSSDSDDDEVMTPRRPVMRNRIDGRERHTQKRGQDESLADFKKNILDVHNEYRAKHGAPPLVWSEACAADAQKCADHCQATRCLSHSHHDNQGQNAFMAMPAKTGAEATASWYSEIKKYNFATSRGPGTGHFTQVVWKASQEMGAARSKDGLYIVANYSPPGNFNGQNAKNVGPPNR